MRLLVGALSIALAMISGRASAQPAPASPPSPLAAPGDAQDPTALMDDEARQHFQIGKTLYDAGRFPQAAEEFEQAYKLSGRPQLLYNMYVAYRDAGNAPKAIESLRGYLEKVPEAADRINLRARLQTMEEAAAKQEEQAKAAAQGEQARKDAEARTAAQAAPSTPEKKETRTEVVESSVVPWILVGIGGAVLVGGTVTGVLALSSASDLEEACSNKTCPESEEDTIDETQTLALVTDFLIPTGAAIAGVGLLLFLTGALDSEREVPVATLGCGPGGCQVNYRGQF